MLEGLPAPFFFSRNFYCTLFTATILLVTLLGNLTIWAEGNYARLRLVRQPTAKASRVELNLATANNIVQIEKEQALAEAARLEDEHK